MANNNRSETQSCQISVVFVTGSAPFNFLREYRHACVDYNMTPQELLSEASRAWQALPTDEKCLFEENEYLLARIVEKGLPCPARDLNSCGCVEPKPAPKPEARAKAKTKRGRARKTAVNGAKPKAWLHLKLRKSGSSSDSSFC
ncbi:uncharacterized protein LOC111072714 [Drosophila obscura]|uniref:uncharacterized protein LOC111072714 n=1 Tax=Drosophila obscura TaxID=7282 RepID=UPI001BB15932|nr:uncharacterized protein LOC111072714 [Drosophila obscura]